MSFRRTREFVHDFRVGPVARTGAIRCFAGGVRFAYGGEDRGAVAGRARRANRRHRRRFAAMCVFARDCRVAALSLSPRSRSLSLINETGTPPPCLYAHTTLVCIIIYINIYIARRSLIIAPFRVAPKSTSASRVRNIYTCMRLYRYPKHAHARVNRALDPICFRRHARWSVIIVAFPRFFLYSTVSFGFFPTRANT